MSEHSHLPPTGSVIEKVEDADGVVYRLAPHCGVVYRYGMAAFLLPFLLLWAGGAIVAVGNMIFAVEALIDRLLFLVWLGGWSLGGAYFVWAFVRLLLPPEAERLVLRRDRLSYDSGNLPMSYSVAMNAFHYGNPAEANYRMWGKRRRMEAERHELEPVSLEIDGMRQHLTIQRGTERIEIGPFLRWPEREWLAGEVKLWQQSQ